MIVCDRCKAAGAQRIKAPSNPARMDESNGGYQSQLCDLCGPCRAALIEMILNFVKGEAK